MHRTHLRSLHGRSTFHPTAGRLPLVTASACLLLTAVVGCASDDTSGSGGNGSTDGEARTAATPYPAGGGGVQAAGQTPGQQTPGQEKINVTMRDVDGNEVGTVTLQSADEGTVRVDSSFDGLDAQGFHGFHIHQNPVCEADAPDGPFTTAGDHYNPGDGVHGKGHAGDLPPVLFSEDGTATQTATTSRFTLEQIRQHGGAVMVHAQSDNLAHIPDRYQAQGAPSPGPDGTTLATGDGGDRIACGVIPAG